MKIDLRPDRWLARLSVGRQLALAFAVLLLLTAAVGGLALFGLLQVGSQNHALAGKWLQGVGLLADMRSAVVDSREQEVKHSRATDRSYRAEYEGKLVEHGRKASAALAAYQPLVDGDAERALVAKLGKAWTAYQQAQQKVVALGSQNQQQDAADISDGLGSMTFDETVGVIGELNKFNFDGGKAAAANGELVTVRARQAVMALIVVALGVGAGLAWAITRHLLALLGGEPQVAMALASAVAQGDLSTRVTLRPGDDSSLMCWLQTMQRGLGDAVRNVRQGAEHVATASAQIAEGNHDLSTRTEQQAGALQQTSSTMEQLGATVRATAENARQANELASGASQVATEGGKVVGEVVHTMKGINDSSRRIADIIAVIDGIAFQTNILALNAAVEAARAGEQGRGFAVVASEVRSLAQRSADAAREIKTLINASVERVEQGTTLVDHAGETMQQIVAAIRKVSDIVAEISSASAEQSTGVSLVGQAVTGMDQATQQNAALVEQSAAAAQSLQEQAEQLVQSVAVFKLAATTH